MVEIDIQKELQPLAREKQLPYHMGHRKRLKEKYAAEGASALRDYELLELLLSFSIPHRDTKPYAKKLLAVFQKLRRILEADLTTPQNPGRAPAPNPPPQKAYGDPFPPAPQQ